MQRNASNDLFSNNLNPLIGSGGDSGKPQPHLPRYQSTDLKQQKRVGGTSAFGGSVAVPTKKKKKTKEVKLPMISVSSSVIGQRYWFF